MALLLGTATLFAQSSIDELAETERAFAAHCAGEGLPEAWVAYFAEDGLIFSPGPKNAHEAYKGAIPSPKPSPFTLHWEPYHGAMAASADLGFNTGPWRISSNQSDTVPPAYGYFFSIWKKNEAGEWKVLLDLGAGVSIAGPEHLFGAPYLERPLKPGPKATADALQEAEGMFNQLSRKRLSNAYERLAAGNLLSTISGFHPFDGREAILKWLNDTASPFYHQAVEFTTIGWAASVDDGFGYSYGSYQLSSGKEKGHYIRVWKKAGKSWYMLAEVCADNAVPRTS